MPIAVGVAPAFGGGFSGGFVPPGTYATSYAATKLLPRVACPPGTQSTPRPGDFSFCTGKIVLSRGGHTIASAPFAVRTNDSHVIHVPLKRRARAAFGPGERVRVHWRATSHDGQGQSATREGDVTFRNTFDR
jgi:hypothetical protein